MANIPVEKKSGTPIIPLLLGLLAVLLLGWLLFEFFLDEDDAILTEGEEEEVVDAPIAAERGEAEPLENISSLAVLAAFFEAARDGELDGSTLAQGVFDDMEMDGVEGSVEVDRSRVEALAASIDSPDDLIGYPVVLDDVEVTGLAGDSTFYIGEGERRILVALVGLGESEDGPGDGSDGVYNVDEGDTIDIKGEVAHYGGNDRGTSDLDEPRRTELATRRYYVRVESL